jgi:hypothetical protein
LLGAAQLWKALFELIQFQVKIVSPLLALPPDNHWFDSASDHGTAVVAITEAFDLLGKYQIAIQVDLLQETDVLIQRISNLISIDEGYRSRDLNASLARLSWITVWHGCGFQPSNR